MKPLLFLLLFSAVISVQAQDITGIWRGSFNQTALSDTRLQELFPTGDRYKFEVQLDQNSKNFEGVTYSYRTTLFYGKATCKGTVNPATRKVLLEEMKLVEVRMAGPGDACVMTLFMQYSRSGDEEIMEGTYTSMNTRDSSNCGKGTVFLRKVPESDFYKEPFLVEKEKEKALEEKRKSEKAIVKTPVKPPVKKTETPKKTTTPPKTTEKKTVTVPEKKTEEEMVRPEIKSIPTDTIKKADVTPAPALVVPKEINTRENELVKTIVTSANEIIVNIYDNGAIDNDTISVYLDKKLVLSKKRLTGQPLTLKFKLDENSAYHELIMVAENLGEIPPNTSLMVVNAGDKQYEVRITSTEQKNAVVRFRYEK